MDIKKNFIITAMIALLMLSLTIGGALAVSDKEFDRMIPARPSIHDEIGDQINHSEARPIMTTIKGLENALLHVNNTNAIARITANLERWQTKHVYNYTQINITETGEGKTLLRAQRRESFLLWKFNITDEYEIDSEGNTLAENRGFISKYLFPPRTIKS
jgi:hypothetical protein